MTSSDRKWAIGPQMANVSDIIKNESALRPVNKKAEDYIQLLDSIEQDGINDSITVREGVDPETKEPKLIIVNGLHRYTCATDLKMEQIPVNVLDIAEKDVYARQTIGNLQRVETKPAAYAKQFQRMMAADPLLTAKALAKRISKSTDYIKKILSLNSIEDDKISALVDDGTIILFNAYALAKLPINEQAEYFERAQTMSAKEFTPLVEARVKEIRDAERKGKLAEAETFTPVSFMQKMGDIKTEAGQTDGKPGGQAAKVLCKGLKTAVEGFNAAIEWTLHRDKLSLQVQKEKWEAKQAAKAAKSVERDANKKAKAVAKAEKDLATANAAAKPVAKK